MKVCIVAEGCYPYVVGGVSSWINSMIKAFPDIEFVVLAIVANRSYRGKFVYELPENVSEVYELYLEDYDWVEQEKNKKLHLRQNEYEALRSLLLNRDVEWDTLFTLFEKKNFSLNALLMGEYFLKMTSPSLLVKISDIHRLFFLISSGPCVPFICHCF